MDSAGATVEHGSRSRDTWRAIGHERIEAVVEDFYDAVQLHPTLSEPFLMVGDWATHKARLTHFWWVALGGAPYRPDTYDVAGKHLGVGVTEDLVDDWLALFHDTLRQHLPDPLAQAWFERARHMARSVRQLTAFQDRKRSRQQRG
ncbi:MAG TPA: group III truncated hemoglobin [Gammaproteobacteria bacterium]|nr:group III truncated hemoglobin [Gammaproteobacteria bacterium]